MLRRAAQVPLLRTWVQAWASGSGLNDVLSPLLTRAGRRVGEAVRPPSTRPSGVWWKKMDVGWGSRPCKHPRVCALGARTRSPSPPVHTERPGTRHLGPGSSRGARTRTPRPRARSTFYSTCCLLWEPQVPHLRPGPRAAPPLPTGAAGSRGWPAPGGQRNSRGAHVHLQR